MKNKKNRKMKFQTVEDEVIAMEIAKMKRMQECYKAMAGIDDPIAFMEYHKKVLEATLLIQKTILELNSNK